MGHPFSHERNVTSQITLHGLSIFSHLSAVDIDAERYSECGQVTLSYLGDGPMYP